LREILVLGDDHRTGSGGVLPDQRIGRLSHAEGKDVLGLVSLRAHSERERGRQLVVDQEARHKAAE